MTSARRHKRQGVSGGGLRGSHAGRNSLPPCHEAVSKAPWEEIWELAGGAQEGDPEGVTFKLGLGDFCEGQGERRGCCQHREQSGPKSSSQKHQGGEQRDGELQARKGSIRRAPRPRLSLAYGRLSRSTK